MDEEYAQEVLHWTRDEYIQLAFRVAFVYHYVTMFGEEVEKIWSQRWMLGKILFLPTQYSTLLGIAPHIILVDRIHLGAIELKGCLALYWITNITMIIVSNSAEASLWLCLYALLGTKKRYLILFMTLFSIFAITSLTFGLRYISGVTAVPISPDDEILGYGCLVVPKSPTITLSTFTIVAYLNLARTSLVAIAGLVTLLVRYRRQDNTLLNVIRREGGIYYISTIVLRVCDTIFRTPGSPAKDEYKIVQVLTSVLAQPILSNRLLLSMRQVDDTHTRSVVSTLLFSPPQGSDSECESYESHGGGSSHAVPPLSRRDHLTGEKGPVDDESKRQEKEIEISSRC